MMNPYFKLFLSTLTVLFFSFCSPQLHAQMFSIDDPEPQRERVLGTTTVLANRMGVCQTSPIRVREHTAAERLDFSDSILRFRLDSPGLDISLAFGGGMTGMDDNSYVNIAGRLYNNFPIKRETSMLIAIPLQLTTDLKQVRQNASDAEFQQSSLVLGSGLTSAFRIGERFSLNLRATPNYGFSFSQGSLFGGSLFRFDGSSVLLIHNVIGRYALSVGYNFDYRNYRIEGDLNDYDFSAHSITVGFGF
jgi:hypothetical protein